MKGHKMESKPLGHPKLYLCFLWNAGMLCNDLIRKKSSTILIKLSTQLRMCCSFYLINGLTQRCQFVSLILFLVRSSWLQPYNLFYAVKTTEGILCSCVQQYTLNQIAVMQSKIRVYGRLQANHEKPWWAVNPNILPCTSVLFWPLFLRHSSWYAMQF